MAVSVKIVDIVVPSRTEYKMLNCRWQHVPYCASVACFLYEQRITSICNPVASRHILAEVYLLHINQKCACNEDVCPNDFSFFCSHWTWNLTFNLKYTLSQSPITAFVSAKFEVSIRLSHIEELLGHRARMLIFGLGLGLVASGLGLVLGLTQCWPRSHEGCPRGLVVSHRNHVIYVTFFPDGKLSLALFLNRALTLLWLSYWMWFPGTDKFYVREQAFIYGVFITYATSLASALPPWPRPFTIWPRPRPRSHCYLASLTSLPPR